MQPRDPVAVWATAAADMVLSFLALTRLGAIPALMNGKLRPEIAAEYIRRLRGVGVLADAAHTDLLAGHDPGVPVLGTPEEAGTGDPAQAPAHYRHHPDDPIVITHTSGTTGVPKAVLHSHASLFAATRHLLSMPQAQGTHRILNALPAPHTATVLMVNQALGNRAEMFLLSEQGGERVLDAIQRWRPDGVFGFSMTWAELARFDLTGYDLDSVRLWFNTGDCSHEPHVRRLVAVGSRDVFTRQGVTRVPGSVFIDGLGSSEMGHSMFHITHTVDTDRYGRCVGRPYRFARVAVLDAEGNELPPARSVSSASTRRRCSGATGTTRSPATGSGCAAGTSPVTWCAPTPTAATTTWTGRWTRWRCPTGGATSPRCPRSGSSPPAPMSPTAPC